MNSIHIVQSVVKPIESNPKSYLLNYQYILIISFIITFKT